MAFNFIQIIQLPSDHHQRLQSLTWQDPPYGYLSLFISVRSVFKNLFSCFIIVSCKWDARIAGAAVHITTILIFINSTWKSIPKWVMLDWVRNFFNPIFGNLAALTFMPELRIILVFICIDLSEIVMSEWIHLFLKKLLFLCFPHRFVLLWQVRLFHHPNH